MTDPSIEVCQELTDARLAVSDWHSCKTQEEVWRWRQAIGRLIEAAKAVALAEANHRD